MWGVFYSSGCTTYLTINTITMTTTVSNGMLFARCRHLCRRVKELLFFRHKEHQVFLPPANLPDSWVCILAHQHVLKVCCTQNKLWGGQCLVRSCWHLIQHVRASWLLFFLFLKRWLKNETRFTLSQQPFRSLNPKNNFVSKQQEKLTPGFLGLIRLSPIPFQNLSKKQRGLGLVAWVLQSQTRWKCMRGIQKPVSVHWAE